MTVEVRITPRRDFDSVIVEAASGVASFTPSCGFSNMAVGAGGSYVCRVDLTGKPSEAAMTLNAVARRAAPGGGLPVLEIHYFSIKTSVLFRRKRQKQRRTTSSRVLLREATDGYGHVIFPPGPESVGD